MAHAALIALVIAPSRMAHLATVPRVAHESIQYMTLQLPGSPNDAEVRPRAVRAAVRRVRPLVAPRLAAFQFTVALDIAPPETMLPPLEQPRLTDSLWADVAGPSLRAPVTAPHANGGTADSLPYIASNVDRIAAADGANPKPAYPSDMLYRMIEAQFAVQFVVDTTGRVDTTTIQIPPSVDRRFAKSVLDVLVRWRFYPAELRGRRVRQLLEQPFEFRIVSGPLA